MNDKKSEFKDREIEEVDLENWSGGTTLTRLLTPEEENSIRRLEWENDVNWFHKE